MPEISLSELRGQLGKRDIKPVYVLYGAETYLRDLAAKTIADFCFADSDLRDFNESEFSLVGETNVSMAISAAEQMPMMAARRVIRITDVRVAATAAKDTIKEIHEEVLAEYLKNPAKSSVVIFVADELHGNRKVGKLLKQHAVAVEFKRFDEVELNKWADKRIKEIGSQADERTVRHLTALAGNDLRRLTNEIEKLSTAALPEKLITIELIDELVPNSRELSNFDLTDHLVAGRGSQALQLLRKILDDGAEPLALLGLISYNYRRLLMAKDMMSKNVDRREIASAVKLFGKGQDDFLAAARRADMQKLVQVIEYIAKTDLAIKTSQGGSGAKGSRLQIEMLVCRLARL